MISPHNISVVIPTYNRAETLRRCISSVLNQTLPPDEVIVVDDGSTDDTRSVIERIDDPRISYIHQANSGANRARNRGVEEARNPWIAFQDADDIWLPHKLEILAQSLESARNSEECEPSVAFSAFITFNAISGSAHLKPNFSIGTESFRVIKDPVRDARLLVENIISTQTLLAHRDTLSAVGYFDESLGRFQDWDLAIRLSQVSPFVFVQEPLVVVEVLPGSISKNYFNGIAVRELFIEKYRDLFSQNPKQKNAAMRAIAMRKIFGKIRGVYNFSR